jgi:hypothetical protein
MNLGAPFAALFGTVVFSTALLAAPAPAPEVGRFFESEQPFFQSQLELVPPPAGELIGGNFVVRGILVPLEAGGCLIFDQELLRVAAIWKTAPGQPPVTLTTMAAISYAEPRRKVAGEHPKPSTRPVLLAGMHPGVSSSMDGLFLDPRPPAGSGDEGRGALPVERGHFDGVELAAKTAVLHYRSEGVAIREWHEGKTDAGVTSILRHLEIQPHSKPLHVTVGQMPTATWSLDVRRHATAISAELGSVHVATNSDSLTFGVVKVADVWGRQR